MGRGKASGKGRRGADSIRRGDSYHLEKDCTGRLWSGAWWWRGALLLVPSLRGGAMDLASLLGGGGLQTQIDPLVCVLGGSTGLL